MATAGFTVVLVAVSLGIVSFGSALGLLLSFIGVLAGVSLIFAGVRMADAALAASVGGPAVFGGAGALAEFLCRNPTVVGLVMASSAVAAASGEPGQLTCFGMLLLLLLGLSVINVGVRVHGE